MEAAKKDSENPHFRSKYADLAAIWDAIRGPLSKNQIAVHQDLFSDPEGLGVRTLLAHSSGEWIEGELVVPLAQRTAQAMGSSATYARRYSLAAAAGVAPEDDDGNAATAGAPAPHQPQSGKKEHRPVSNRQAAQKPADPKLTATQAAHAAGSDSKETDAALLNVKVRRLWDNFTKAGGKTPDWEPWLTQSIGEKRNSKTLTLADCAKLEMELANGLKLIAEPPAETAPLPSEPTPEDDGFKVPPVVRMTALANEFRMPVQDFWRLAEKHLGKKEGWTHPDVDAMHAEMVRIRPALAKPPPSLRAKE
jgi:hypothetical protein